MEELRKEKNKAINTGKKFQFIFLRILSHVILIPGVVDFSDVVVLDLVVSSVILVVGVVTVVTLVVISVVEYSKRRFCFAVEDMRY